MKKILFVIGDEFDDSEFMYPYYRVIEEGYIADIVSISMGEVCGKYHFKADTTISLSSVQTSNYNGLIIPGGKGPEKLRLEERIVSIVREFMDCGKPVAAICHGQQILISARVLGGKTATCYPGIREDLINADCNYVNEQAVVCGNLVTSRRPEDLPYFMREFLKLLER